ncbi:HNH endonuclease [Polyangium sp. 15x6]|uniref:HNH endonuclease n=1 Tax=Polyangium sp. 15x6 TaxID=3042687 RepID=UPI00249C549B|nr:HNH endonuclease [Polyangium sp. 15x6]MDI3285984.1 HNH endonuclease [Polyangium sp. 15x6]
MSICKLCKKQDAMSLEHVIPSALGGTLQVKGILCTKCNSESGRGIDAELIKAFDFARMLLDIRGDRGQAANVRGQDPKLGGLILESGGKPRPMDHAPQLLSENADGSKTYRVASPAAARRFVEAQRRKNPGANYRVNEAWTTSSFSDMVNVNFSIGGEDFYRSCVKSILSLLIVRGVTDSQILDAGAWRYVAGASGDESGVHTCLAPAQPLWSPSERLGKMYHAITVHGDSSTRDVRAEVRFFGGISVGVEIRGAACTDCRFGYAVDPMTGEEQDHDTWSGALAAPPRYITDEVIESTRQAVTAIVKTGLERQNQQLLHDITDRAMAKAFAGLEEGAPIPAEVLDRLAEEVALDFTRHLMRTDWKEPAPDLVEELNRRKS